MKTHVLQVSRGRGLLAGHRQCHVATAAHELCDISPGPNASGAWTNCICVIADLITDDSTRLAELKSSFSEDAWRKCERHAANRLGQQHPCRDGRPNYSWIPLAWQPLAPFRVRGGYCQ